MRASAAAAPVAVALVAAACSRSPAADAGPRTEAVAQPTPLGPLGTPTGIPVIDFHTHVDPRFPAVFGLRLDEAGIGVAINMSGGSPRALEFSAAAQAETGGRLRFFCVVPWGYAGAPDFVPAVVQYLGQCKAAGGLGVKIAKALGLGVPDPATGALLAVDDPWLDPVFEEAGRLGLPVAMHVGDPKAFFEKCDETNERWEELSANTHWCFSDRTMYPSWEDLFAAFIRRVARHPEVTFVGLHFGNDPEEPARVARVMREHPNLWIDTAARVPEIGRHPPEEVRAVFLEFSDRIVFGTDLQVDPEMLVLGSGSPYASATQEDVERFWRSTWRYFETADPDIPSPTPIQGRWTVHGIALPRDVLERFYHGNAERLLGIHI